MNLLIFDSLILAQANLQAVARGGIYRYASQLLIALAEPSIQQQFPIHLLPFCPDPLVAGSAEQELKALEDSFLFPLRSMPHVHPGVTRDGVSARALAKFSLQFKRLLRPAYRRLQRTSWLQYILLRRLEERLDGIDPGSAIFHTPFQSVPEVIRRRSLPHVVVTIHDMLPRIHPEFFTHETIRQFNLMLELLRPTDHVICNSESTRRDFLQSKPKVPTSQVHVTPLAAAPWLQRVTDKNRILSLRKRLGLSSDDQVVLSLCTLEPRKNLKTLIRAFEQLSRRSGGNAIKLVLAGALGWKTDALTEQIRTSSAAKDMVVSGHIHDYDLACLYSLADVFVYPSLYEGFGLPPLEAMQCGAPVIVGNASSLTEVVGDAALLVDPLSTAELVTALDHLLGSAEERKNRRRLSIARSACFSWHNTAACTTNVYRNIINA
jgi:glycosyltransferase involved in cell wall biosynthesis